MLDETMDSILPPADVGEALKAPTHVVAELARRRREYEGLVARYRSLSAHCLRVESKCSEKDKVRLEIAKPQCWEPLCLDPRLNPCARVCSRGSPLRPVLQVVRCPRGIGGSACQTKLHAHGRMARTQAIQELRAAMKANEKALMSATRKIDILGRKLAVSEKHCKTSEEYVRSPPPSSTTALEPPRRLSI